MSGGACAETAPECAAIPPSWRARWSCLRRYLTLTSTEVTSAGHAFPSRQRRIPSQAASSPP